MITLTGQVRIMKNNIFSKNGLWWVYLKYNDGGEDIYGPYHSKSEAERLIY